jgi:hypothetical protein
MALVFIPVPDYVVRLRESQKEFERNQYEEGKEAGIEFAKTVADYEDLVALKEAQDTFDDAKYEFPLDWEACLGEDDERGDDREFERGFIDGACEVLEEV